MADEFTDKQRAFVLEYLKDRNGTAAAIRAGYSPRSAKQSACELLTDPRYAHVRDAVDKALAEQSARVQVDADNVLRAALEIRRRCMRPKTFDAKGANAANALLAKHVGIGGPNVNINIDFDKLTDAQLEHLANGGSLGNLPH